MQKSYYPAIKKTTTATTNPDLTRTLWQLNRNVISCSLFISSMARYTGYTLFYADVFNDHSYVDRA